MNNEVIIKSYHGGLQFLESNAKNSLIIFVIDDQVVYANLLKDKLSENKNFSIYTFETGEEAIPYLKLKPDLVIIDYHLDGKVSHAKKGDVIAEIVADKSPSSEVMLISSDHKLSFISGLEEKSQKIMYKDGYTSDRIDHASKKIFGDKKIHRVADQVIVAGIVAFVLIFSWIIIT